MTTDERLDRIERRQRATLATLGALAVAAAVVGFTRQPDAVIQDLIVAREIRLVDEDGAVRILLMATTSPHPVTVPPGARLAIVTNEGGGSLMMFDAAGAHVVELTERVDGGVLKVYNVSGKMVVTAAAGPDGGMVSVTNAEGQLVAVLAAGADGRGEVIVVDPKTGKMGSLAPR